VYVDDLAIAALDPGEIIKHLKECFNLSFKGVGPMKFHLGCNFERDDDGTLSFGPKTYISKMLDNYERMFGSKPREYSSPLEPNDHPELDDTELLESEGIKQYQSMIGAAQWAISLGRFDIHTSVMTMSHFRIAPRIGHLERLKRLYGYLKRYKDGAIRVRVDKPDLSQYPTVDYDWLHSVYGNVQEVIPADIPEPLGETVVTSSYSDANLQHDMLTGRAVTGTMHFVNGTPGDWYTKRQATVETATYGSEFVAARTAVDQIIDLRITLRYLGVKVEGKSYLFSDSASVIASSTIPHASLKKRHNALSYHRVREAIAAGIIYLLKIEGKYNPSDVLSKHYGHSQVWPIIKALLFWKGNVEIGIPSVFRNHGECKPGSHMGKFKQE
jgi:hypothetical protein